MTFLLLRVLETFRSHEEASAGWGLPSSESAFFTVTFTLFRSIPPPSLTVILIFGCEPRIRTLACCRRILTFSARSLPASACGTSADIFGVPVSTVKSDVFPISDPMPYLTVYAASSKEPPSFSFAFDSCAVTVKLPSCCPLTARSSPESWTWAPVSLLATVTVCFAIHAFLRSSSLLIYVLLTFAEALAPSRREAAVIVASLSTVLPSASVTLSDMPLSVSVRRKELTPLPCSDSVAFTDGFCGEDLLSAIRLDKVLTTVFLVFCAVSV